MAKPAEKDPPYGEGPWQGIRYRYKPSELDDWLTQRLGADWPLFAGGADYEDAGHEYFPGDQLDVPRQEAG